MRLGFLKSLERYLIGLGIGIQSAAYSFKKAFSSAQNLSGRVRETSFPFISGDTFRGIADVLFDTGQTTPFSQVAPRLPRPCLVFAEVGFLAHADNGSHFLAWLAEQEGTTKPCVIISNGDKVPADEYFRDLSKRCSRIFSVNVGDYLPNVVPIPLGIENQTKKRFGFLDDFLLYREQVKQGGEVQIVRDQMFLFSFSIRTNREARVEAVREAKRWQRFSKLRVSSNSAYRRALMRHNFVICPEGNGKDTHRVWEALYLGAVPIIRKGSLASSITSGLPIWEVDEWSDCFSRTDEDLIAKFRWLQELSIEKAFFPYWQNLVFEPRLIS